MQSFFTTAFHQHHEADKEDIKLDRLAKLILHYNNNNNNNERIFYGSCGLIQMKMR